MRHTRQILSPNSRLHLLAVAALVATFGWAASAAPASAWPADAALEQKVEKRLSNKDLAGIEVSADGKAVTLAGTVKNLRQAQRAERYALNVDGVAEVYNQLSVATAGRSDAAIEGELQDILDVYLRSEVFDWVDAAVTGGEVMLTGRVYDPSTKNRIERAVAKVPGVWSIVDSVEILPVSLGDDEIRQQALIALYGHPAFSHFAFGQTPPIHIIVAAGHVTLQGTVSSEVQARLAESLVRSGTLSHGVDNQVFVTSRQRG